MRILLTKTSMTHHKLEVVRDDGSREEALLETKSFMPHDLIHYALESEARLSMSFWGLVSRGHRFLDLNAKDPMAGSGVPRDELGETEMMVGALTGFAQGKVSPVEFLGLAGGMFRAHGKPMPPYLTLDFLRSFSERLRALLGQWRAAKKDETIELTWPPLNPDRPAKE